MKSDFLTALKEVDNFTFTENGAGALRSTGNKMLDAFGSLAAMKDCDESTILHTFMGAFSEDKELAMKLLFYVRDIRGGQGMRRVFRIIVRYLANSYPEIIKKNLDNFLFFGRGDDLMVLFDTACEKDMIEYVRETLYNDFVSVGNGGSCSLLAKWMPSINTSSTEAVKLAKRFVKAFGITDKEYRKMLSALRREISIVESYMSANEWHKIPFDKLPSKAAMIYSDAFMKHCEKEYLKYLEDVAAGKAKVNAGALFPVDIIHNVMQKGYKYSVKDKYLYDAMWKALPNFFGDTEETGMCVVDVSGSMYGVPMKVAISLGMYCADKCNGPFKNHFITFSAHPRLQEIKGDDIFQKVVNMQKADWEMNTNLESVFDLILDAAVSNHMKQEDLPSKLYIISDMQFDAARGGNTYYDHILEKYVTEKRVPFMQTMKKKFADNGYVMPALVYWNVRASEAGMFQDTFEGENCCMVSGYSPSLFKSVIDGTEFVEKVVDGKTVVEQKLDPMNVMMTTLNNERYDRVIVR